MSRDDRKWTWHWRSLAAVVYLIICLTDFVIMPVYREWTHSRLKHPEMMAAARGMEGATAQVETLRILREDRPWTPITNDTFHIAFGAILGVSALPMNRTPNNNSRPGARRREDDPVVAPLVIQQTTGAGPNPPTPPGVPTPRPQPPGPDDGSGELPSPTSGAEM